jgi:protein SCO1/2
LLAGAGVIALVVTNLPYTFHGSTIEPPFSAPDLPLVSSQGATFHLDQDRGKVVLIFFGYTYCPDVCPATLAQLRQVLGKLGNQANSVQILFVTVDPKRDNADQMKRYLETFGPGYLGLTGTEDQMTPVWKAYGVYREVVPASNPDAYSMNHSTRVYLIDPNGQLRLTYTDASEIDSISADIRHVLGGG